MSFELLAFYAFAAITVMSALAVVSVKNPVHAVLFLVLTFFSTACLWLLAEGTGVLRREQARRSLGMSCGPLRLRDGRWLRAPCAIAIGFVEVRLELREVFEFSRR